MKKMKKTLYTLVGVGLLTMNSVSSVGAWWEPNENGGECKEWVCPTGETGLFNVVQNIIGWLTGFLYIVAVIYWLWWGFQILTASGEEEKVKKWKKVLINAWIWLVIIFLASSVVQFVFQALNSFNSGNP
jgi:type IV secretory pathway VirB2 component (pilin)